MFKCIFNELRKESFGATLEAPEKIPDGSERYSIKITLADVDLRLMWKEHVQFQMNQTDRQHIEFEGANKIFKIWWETEIVEEVRKWSRDRVERKKEKGSI